MSTTKIQQLAKATVQNEQIKLPALSGREFKLFLACIRVESLLLDF